jgi:mercuric ion transport protein
VSRPWTPSGSLVAGAAAAIGASACCAGPLLLVVLGIGGAWGSRLVAMEAYQPLCLAAAAAFFGFAFYRLYRKPEACAPGEACAIPAVRHRQRIIFWVVTLIAAALMAFPLYAPLFH